MLARDVVTGSAALTCDAARYGVQSATKMLNS
jgi:hypothetical protein